MRKSVSREHLLGVTLWAFAAGAVKIEPWVRRDHYQLCRRVL